MAASDPVVNDIMDRWKRETMQEINLKTRLQENGDTMIHDLQRRISACSSHRQMADLALDLYHVCLVYAVIENNAVIKPADIAYLQGYENPMALMVQELSPSGTGDYQNMWSRVENFLEDKKNFPDHPRTPDAPTQRGAAGHGPERRSLLADLQREQERPTPSDAKEKPDKGRER